MGVIIPNMQFPKTCKECDLSVWEPNVVSKRPIRFCAYYGVNVTNEIKWEWCGLKEVK